MPSRQFHRGLAKHQQLWAGLVGAWSPNLGPTGATLRDWSGRANHGTLTNMTLSTAWVLSRGAYALDFNGIDNYVDVASFGVIDATNEFSISLWFQTTGNGAMFAMGNSGNVLPYTILSLASGGLDFAVRNDGGANCEIVTTATYNDGNWHHVVAVRVLTSPYIRLYVDGKQVSSFSSDSSTTNPSGAITLNNTRFGHYGRATPILWYTGKSDDYRAYNRALRESEIVGLYRGGFGRGSAYEMMERKVARSVQRVLGGATMTGGMYQNMTGGFVA